MQTDEPGTDEGCWNFVIEFYAKQGVSQACLLLQDQLGVDVSFFLTALFYSARRGVNLTAEEIERLDRHVSAWHNEIILPLRKVRRRLREGHPAIKSPSGDELYRQIKAAELLAEQLEIGALVQQLEKIARDPASAQSNRTTIEGVVKYFAGASEPGPQRDDAAIESAISVLDAASS
jgi:uncharacterized protein (TIGR02444 family)